MGVRGKTGGMWTRERRVNASGRLRRVVNAVAAAAVSVLLLGVLGFGYGTMLALRGLPAGATAHVIAGLAGLPPYAGVSVAVTLLLAALQVLAGAWLARAPLRLPPSRSRANE